MFPHTFVRQHLFTLTRPGDVILDPFSGRGTTLLESLLLDRKALAVDINAVAACVTGAKAHIPILPAIESRLDELERHCKETDWPAADEEHRAFPSFFAQVILPWASGFGR
jgi:DNA methylase